MNILTKAQLLAHIAKWRLTWNKRDIHYKPAGLDDSKFITATQAVKKNQRRIDHLFLGHGGQRPMLNFLLGAAGPI